MTRAPAPLTVLVLGASGNVSQGILKSLALSSLRPRVVAACVTARAVGLFNADRAYLSPYATDPGFVDWVTEVCRAESVAAILSGVEPVLEVLSENASQIAASTGAVAVVSPPPTLAVGQDKLRTCTWLRAQGLPHPDFAAAEDREDLARLVRAHGLPLVAKPRRGRGARGVRLLRTAAELDALDGDPTLLVQEHLPGADGEYTVGCLCDRDGRVRGRAAMRRELADGTTVAAESGPHAEVAEVAQRVVAELAPVGPCNVQLRRDGERIVPFEVNVRFSGTTPMRARLGFNEVEAALRHLVLGEDAVDLPAPAPGTILRYFNELYVPDAALEQLRRDGRLEDPRKAGATVERWGMDRGG